MFKLSQFISLFLLGPFLFYPFFICPFGLAYLYCSICPYPCPGGRIRGILLLIVLGLNIKRDIFCTLLCPGGKIQSLLFKINSPKLVLPKMVRSFKFVILFLTVAAIAQTIQPDWFAHKLMSVLLSGISILKTKGWLLLLFLLTMTLSIFSYRIFCYNFCPLRALSAILHKIVPGIQRSTLPKQNLTK